MANTGHHIVVSWTGADGEDSACFCVAIYEDANTEDVADFVTIEDSDSPNDALGISDSNRREISLAIDAFAREYNIDANSLPITWDI